jgi:hypothetical protein
MKTIFFLSLTLATVLFFSATLSVSNSSMAFKETKTSCSDGAKAGKSDYTTRGQVNSKYSEHTDTYKNCYLDGWKDKCESDGNARSDCEADEDNQY